MLTVQDFPASANVSPRIYFSRVAELFSKACPAGDIAVISEADENGYPAAVVQMVCPNNPATGKPELTWMKGISSSRSLYVVQKAFRFEPDPAQVRSWMKYLGSVTLCDEVGTAHPCP